MKKVLHNSPPKAGYNKVWAEFDEPVKDNPNYNKRSVEYMLTLMRNNEKVVFLTALFTWLCAPSALAHSLHVFAQYDGHKVSGKAYYSDMTPAAETHMEILQAGQDSLY